MVMLDTGTTGNIMGLQTARDLEIDLEVYPMVING